jgi:hypothetical protein
LIQELYDEASEDVKNVVQQVLELETANLHYERPPEIVSKIALKIKSKIVEETE